MPLYDQYGNAVRTGELRRELAGPTVSGVRSILSEHPAQGLTPGRLGALLREAEHGDARGYLALAEEMEEKNLHYNAVLGTRKRQVAQLDIHVEEAGDGADEKRDADLVRDWLTGETLDDELVDILDATGKGYSASEIMWDVGERQWIPRRLEYRDPRWFEFDRIDGRTLMLRGETGELQPLAPWKFITHRFRAKSGLPIRGGFARMAAWFYLFANYALKDWVQFIETYGQPTRIGKYPSSASPEDRDVLLRALTNLGADAAAMIPESMTIELIEGKQGGQGAGSAHGGLLAYIDALISKAVLGQTLTTEAGDKGARALGQVHDGVRGDIERADASALGQTLTRDLVRPLVALNHGERERYPRIRIGRPETIDIARIADALAKLVPLGLRVGEDAVRGMLGFDAPRKGDDVLGAASPPGGEPGEDPPDPEPPAEDPDAEERAEARAGARLLLRALGRSGDRRPDEIERAIDALLEEEGWEPLAEPVIEPILATADAALTRGESLEGFRAELPQMFAAMDDTMLVRALRRMGFSAALSGDAGLGETIEGTEKS